MEIVGESDEGIVLPSSPITTAKEKVVRIMKKSILTTGKEVRHDDTCKDMVDREGKGKTTENIELDIRKVHE